MAVKECLFGQQKRSKLHFSGLLSSFLVLCTKKEGNVLPLITLIAVIPCKPNIHLSKLALYTGFKRQFSDHNKLICADQERNNMSFK